MADEKDKKPKNRADAMYDHKSSVKARGESVPDKEAAATAEADVESGDKPRADGDMKPVEKASDRYLDALKKLHKLHDRERDDFVSAHSDGLKAMAKRHQSAMAEMLGAMDEAPEAAPEMAAAEPAAAPAPMEA